MFGILISISSAVLLLNYLHGRIHSCFGKVKEKKTYYLKQSLDSTARTAQFFMTACGARTRELGHEVCY